MKTLLEIKNQYSQEQGYNDWDDLWHDHINRLLDFELHMDEICIRAQKAALEKAAENAVAYKLAYPNNISKAVVEKDSITNPENLIQ